MNLPNLDAFPSEDTSEDQAATRGQSAISERLTRLYSGKSCRVTIAGTPTNHERTVIGTLLAVYENPKSGDIALELRVPWGMCNDRKYKTTLVNYSNAALIEGWPES